MPYDLESGYPSQLRSDEEYLIKWRRDAIDAFSHDPENAVDPIKDNPLAWGLALSGGGIRSATFCLGVLQSFARARILTRFDYLSTVSGGGFIGGYLGAAINRDGIASVQKELADDCSRTIRWFRENGRYLAPNGLVDLWTAAATMLRNLLSVHVVVASALLASMVAIQLLRGVAMTYGDGSFYFSIEPGIGPSRIYLSPLLPLTLLPLLLWFLPASWAFWLTQRRGSAPIYPFLGAMLTVVGTGLIALLIPIGREAEGAQRIHLMIVHGIGITAFCAIAFWALAAYRAQEGSSSPATAGIGPASIRVMAGCALGALVLVGLVASMSPLVVARIVLVVMVIVVAFHGFRLARHFEPELLREHRRQARAFLTRSLTASLLIISAMVAIGVGDTLAQSLYEFRVNTGLRAYGLLLGAIFIGGTAALPWIQKATGYFGLKLKASLGFIAGIAAVVLAGIYLVSLSVVAYWIRLGGQHIDQPGSIWYPVFWFVGLLSTVVLVGRLFGFVNTSSLQDFYAARLTRAYLGASNPERVGTATGAPGTPVTEALPTDDVLMPRYAPHMRGGPLHLINITVNETVSGKSQIEQQDRRGLPIAFGPAGISVGVHHHAVWKESLISPGGVGASLPPSEADVKRTQLKCAGPGAPQGDGNDNFPVTTYQIWPARSEEEEPIAPESLSLGYLMGISGAAFSTGLGKRTGMATSILAGMFNVRLGYWWDSGVDPRTRHGEVEQSTAQQLGRWFARWVPVHMALLDEFLGRFHGPARRRWYLSDGGHYENTAAYELLRRRVPVIVVCDCGADDAYGFGDIGALVRLAETDFGAEVRFFNSKDGSMALQGISDHIGDLPEIVPTETWREGFDLSKKQIAVARVEYKNSDDGSGKQRQHSLLILLKPSLTKALPMQLLEYRYRQEKFPQQPTTDQFFDEAQWESYRKLGTEIGAAAAALLKTDNSLLRLSTIKPGG